MILPRLIGTMCARCGEQVDGYGRIGDDILCHPDDQSKPDCYRLESWRRTFDGTYPTSRP